MGDEALNEFESRFFVVWFVLMDFLAVNDDESREERNLKPSKTRSNGG